MDRYFLFFTILLLFNFCSNINIEVGDEYKLPEPKKEGGMGLYEALNHRKSSRDFDGSKDFPEELLSQALWSCYGVTEYNHRTVPSDNGWYPLLTYVFLKDGVYQYIPETHALIKFKDGDHREISGTQTEAVTAAGVNFVFVADIQKESKIPDEKSKRLAIKYDTGHLTMVLSLFASANNMKGVVRGNFNTYKIFDFLELESKTNEITLAFSLGY